MQAAQQYQGPGSAAPTPIRTLAARLEGAAQTIAYQCERIETTLAKINGTPRGPSAGESPAKIATTSPLTTSVEQVEMHAKRLCDLAAGLEQVA